APAVRRPGRGRRRGGSRPPPRRTRNRASPSREEPSRRTHSRMRYETMLALRYLGARRRQTFISFISIISMLGVAVGVAALILALAGQSGLHHDILARILGANAHVTVFAPAGASIEDPGALARIVEAVPEVEATSPVCFERGLITSEIDPTGTAVFLKG